LHEATTLIKFAISNLLLNPPTEGIESLIISCKNDETFAAFLKQLLEEQITP